MNINHYTFFFRFVYSVFIERNKMITFDGTRHMLIVQYKFIREFFFTLMTYAIILGHFFVFYNAKSDKKLFENPVCKLQFE